MTTTTITAWLDRVQRLLADLAALHPEHAAAADELGHLARQVAHAAPRALAYADPGDGLRSPSTEGGGHAVGSHSDPTLAAVLAGLGRESIRLDASRASRSLTVTHLVAALTTDDDATRRRLVGDARRALGTALSALHEVLPATTTLSRIRATAKGDPGCASCRRVSRFSPASRPGSLCDTCYRYALARRGEWADANPEQTPAVPGAQRWWPPRRWVEQLAAVGHTRGITPGVLARWEAEERKPKPKRRKRSA